MRTRPRSDGSAVLLLCVGSGVGALRKHAGGMFLASDRGGYAAAASILSLKVPSYAVRAVGDAGPYAATAGNRP